MSNSHENVFDEIMLQVGNSGNFQKYYNIIFNFAFVIFGTMASFGTVISLAIPDHWCNVPGREHTNFTLKQWKNLTIPWSNHTTGFSHCTMYNENDTVTECLYGWEYDQTYYGQTIASQENWVCQQEMYVTNFLVFGKIGEILGTAMVQLGDIYGRRPIFVASLAFLIIGRLGLLFSSGIFWMFAVFSVIGSLPSLSIYQAPLVISMEISSVEGRTFIPLMQSVAFTAGICIGPLLFWVFSKWVIFTLISTLPIFVFLFIWPFMIESPRWLASRGQVKKCLGELQKIAKFNNTKISDKLLLALNQKASSEKEKTYTVITLFSSWKLAKKTILVIIGWICYMIIYIILFLNVTNLKGNPFINYFWQGLAELPGYFLGKYLSDKTGRKFTKTISFLAMAVISFIVAYILLTTENVVVISVCGIAMKFLSSIVFYTMNLQTLEIYPTCLRQTGASVGFLMASVFGIFTPYIIYLGVSINPSLPYVASGILALVGGITGFFLPETYNQKLPETVSEAEHFGDDQKLFSLPFLKQHDHRPVPINEI